MHWKAEAAILLILATLASSRAMTNKTDEEIAEVEGRGIRDRARDVWNFFFGEGDDYDYDDYSFDFDPNSVSSYTWYNPSAGRRETDVADDEEDYSWGEVALGAVLALAPLGLLVAAFPAGLFTIAVKKRSFSEDNILEKIDPTELPLLTSLQDGDLLSLVRPDCQKKLFCEISQLGKHESASFLQKAFYYIAQLMPDNMSRRLRLQRLFAAARENQCVRYTCHKSSIFSNHKSPSNHLRAPSDDLLLEGEE